MNAAHVLGDRRNRRLRARAVAAAVFLAGAAAGGAASGAVATAVAALAGPLHPAGPVAGVGLAAAAVAVHARLGAEALPQRRRLIPQEVFHESYTFGLFQFGAEYGSGVRTYVTSSAPFVALGALVAVAPPLAVGTAVGAAFGVAKGLSAAAGTVGRLEGWHRLVDRQARWLVWLPVVVAAVLAGALVTGTGLAP